MRHLCLPTVSHVPSPLPGRIFPSSVNAAARKLTFPLVAPGSPVIVIVPCTVPKPVTVPRRLSCTLVSPKVVDVTLYENSPSALPTAMQASLFWAVRSRPGSGSGRVTCCYSTSAAERHSAVANVPTLVRWIFPHCYGNPVYSHGVIPSSPVEDSTIEEVPERTGRHRASTL